jgi:hypothetical protein
VVNGDLEDVCIPRGFAAAVIKWRDLSTWVPEPLSGLSEGGAPSSPPL